MFADVTLLATSVGGRMSPTTPTTFRCLLRIAGTCHDVRLDLHVGERLAPGTSAICRVRFLDQGLLQEIVLGEVYEIWESRVVGTAKVVALCSARASSADRRLCSLSI